jgi:SM-20-related protein
MTGNDGEVSVMLLLNGGHTRTLFLRRKDPLLSSLVSSIGEKSYGGGRPARPFNIHLDQGRRSFIFSSSDLVGLITDPPLPGEHAARAPAGARLPADPTLDKSPYVMLENFIDAPLHAELLRFVMAHEKDFAPRRLGERQRALVLREFAEFAGIFRDRVHSLLPQLAVAFGIGEFRPGDIECEVAALNDGDFYRVHSDIDAPDTEERAITYVYYFNNEPRSFSGGAFRLYGGRFADGRYECGDPAAELDPKNNSILFFPSHCHHEVLPVRCPSNRFVDSRFAVKGWVRRARRA